MIKDIIDQFVFRKTRGGSAVTSRQERTASVNSEVLDTRVQNMEPPKEETNESTMVEVGRDWLMSLLGKSRQKKVRVSQELLEQLNWQGPPAPADAPSSNGGARSNHQPYRYEAQFQKTQIVIDGIDYDESSDDSLSASGGRRNAPSPLNSTPLTISTIESPKTVATRVNDSSPLRSKVFIPAPQKEKTSTEPKEAEGSRNRKAGPTSQHMPTSQGDLKKPRSRQTKTPAYAIAKSSFHQKSTAAAQKILPKKVDVARKLSLKRKSIVVKTKPQVDPKALASTAATKDAPVLAPIQPQKMLKKSMESPPKKARDALKSPIKGLSTEKKSNKVGVTIVTTVRKATESAGGKAEVPGKASHNRRKDQTKTASLKQPVANVELSKKKATPVAKPVSVEKATRVVVEKVEIPGKAIRNRGQYQKKRALLNQPVATIELPEKKATPAAKPVSVEKVTRLAVKKVEIPEKANKNGGKDQMKKPSLRQPVINIELPKKATPAAKTVSVDPPVKDRVTQTTTKQAGAATDGKNNETPILAPKKTSDHKASETGKAGTAIASVKKDLALGAVSVSVSKAAVCKKAGWSATKKMVDPSLPKPTAVIQKGFVNHKKNEKCPITTIQATAIEKKPSHGAKDLVKPASSAKIGDTAIDTLEQAALVVLAETGDSLARKIADMAHVDVEKSEVFKSNGVIQAKHPVTYASKNTGSVVAQTEKSVVLVLPKKATVAQTAQLHQATEQGPCIAKNSDLTQPQALNRAKGPVVPTASTRGMSLSNATKEALRNVLPKKPKPEQRATLNQAVQRTLVTSRAKAEVAPAIAFDRRNKKRVESVNDEKTEGARTKLRNAARGATSKIEENLVARVVANTQNKAVAPQKKLLTPVDRTEEHDKTKYNVNDSRTKGQVATVLTEKVNVSKNALLDTKVNEMIPTETKGDEVEKVSITKAARRIISVEAKKTGKTPEVQASREPPASESTTATQIGKVASTSNVPIVDVKEASSNPTKPSPLVSTKAPEILVSQTERIPIVQDLTVFPTNCSLFPVVSKDKESDPIRPNVGTLPNRKTEVVGKATADSMKITLAPLRRDETVTVKNIDATAAEQTVFSSHMKPDSIVQDVTVNPVLNDQAKKRAVAPVGLADPEDATQNTLLTPRQETSKSNELENPDAGDLNPTKRPRPAELTLRKGSEESRNDSANMGKIESNAYDADLAQENEVTTQTLAKGAASSNGLSLSKQVAKQHDPTLPVDDPMSSAASSKRGEKRKSAEGLEHEAEAMGQDSVLRLHSKTSDLPADAVGVEDTLNGEGKHVKKRKKRRNQFLLKELEAFGNPGILSVCHKPKVFRSQLHFRAARGKKITNLLIEQLSRDMTMFKNEIPVVDKAGDVIKKQFPNCIVDPTRVERGYFKTHLDADFVDSFAASMPECVRIKRTVSKKGIAFISTVGATLSHTHYDQDTSFLLLLSGAKEIFYAPPSMADKLRQDHPVLSHSSIFEFVNPFVEAAGTLWKFATLHAGDGLLLPQGWLHAVKSTPGTIAISFQVEASGSDATSPFLRRSRSTAPEDLRHLSCIDVQSDIEKYATSEAAKTVENEVVPKVISKKLHRTVVVQKKRPELSSNITDSSNKKDGTCLDFDNLVPLEVKSNNFELSSTSNGSRMPDGQERRRSLHLEPPPILRVAASGRKRKSIPASYIFPTRSLDHSQIRSSNTSARRSGRQKHYCGVQGCKNMFPANNGLMWVMVLQLGIKGTLDLPPVPTFHPKHLICCECRETNGQSIFLPEEVLNEQDKKEIKGWEKYRYYAATKADYQKWADHDGENGKLLAAIL